MIGNSYILLVYLSFFFGFSDQNNSMVFIFASL